MTWGMVALANLLAAVGVGIPAVSAQAPIARARLELRAPSTCTGSADLVARVVARSPRIQFVEDSAAVAVRATFTVARPGGVSAELVLVESGMAGAQRRLVTRTCPEAADAVALMIAVALDPVWVNEHRTAAAGESDTDGSADRTSGASTAPQGTSQSSSGLAEKSKAEELKQPPPPPQVSPPAQVPQSITPPHWSPRLCWRLQVWCS